MEFFRLALYILLALLTLSSQLTETITTRLEQRFPRQNPLITTNDDWELGLREAVHQTLIKEKYKIPNLRNNIFDAPIIGRQNKALPFGDVTILARGQLYNTIDGLKFIQDPYQNDCDDCHNHNNDCNGHNCDNLNYYNRQLLALWTVKRLRHKNHYGHIYELEFTVSPISQITNDYLTRNGNYNYNLPGHVFVIKSDTRLNYHVNNNPEKHRFIDELQAPQHPAGSGHPQLLKPIIINVNTDGYRYYIPNYQQQTKPTIDPKELELYKQLLEALRTTEATKTTQYGPQTFPPPVTSHTPPTKVVDNVYVPPTPKPVTTITYYAPVDDDDDDQAPDNKSTKVEGSTTLFGIFKENLSTTPIGTSPTTPTPIKTTSSQRVTSKPQPGVTLVYPSTYIPTQPQLGTTVYLTPTPGEVAAVFTPSTYLTSTTNSQRLTQQTTPVQTPVYTIFTPEQSYTTPEKTLGKTSTATGRTPVYTTSERTHAYTNSRITPGRTTPQQTMTYTTSRTTPIYTTPEKIYTTPKKTYTTHRKTPIYTTSRTTPVYTTPSQTPTYTVPRVTSTTSGKYPTFETTPAYKTSIYTTPEVTSTTAEKIYATLGKSPVFINTTPIYFTQTETQSAISTNEPTRVVIYETKGPTTSEITTEPVKKQQPQSINDQLPPPEKDTDTTIPYVTTVTEPTYVDGKSTQNPSESTQNLLESTQKPSESTQNLSESTQNFSDLTYTPEITQIPVKNSFEPDHESTNLRTTQNPIESTFETQRPTINTIANEITTPIPKKQSRTTPSNFLVEENNFKIKDDKIKGSITNDDIFGSEKPKKRKKTTKKPYVEAQFANELFGPSTTKPKIIYSNFYTAASAPQTTNLENFETTTQLEPNTDQSFVTSISYLVNKRNKTKENLKQEQKQLVEETKLEENNTETNKRHDKHIAEINDKDIFDDLAIRLVSNAKSIDYLDKKNRKPKYRRRTFLTRKKKRKEN